MPLSFHRATVPRLTLCHSFTRDILRFVISPFLTLTKLTENRL